MISKKGLHVFFYESWAPFFLNQTTLGVIFSRIVGDFSYTCRDFDHIFKDFARIFRNFARIFDKSKLLSVRLHP